MQIHSLYEQGRPVLSLELFPPKSQDDLDSIVPKLSRMAALKPDFASVTFGAGGAEKSVDSALHIASTLKELGVLPMSHLTCVGASKESIAQICARIRELGIENILALRGDLPGGAEGPATGDYPYASDLIRALTAMDCFDIGAACYPEGHINTEQESVNYQHLKEKEEAGARFFVSQLFFENELFYRFLDGVRAHGVQLPISAGIMPILGRSQIERMIFMCGASLPARIVRLLYRYQDSPEDLRKAGIEAVCLQAQDLAAHGVDGIHVFTMNQPDIAEAVFSALGA